MTEPIMHETKTHGKLSFPYIVYRGSIPEYIQSYPLHWHDEMEIIYVTGGKGLVTVQTKKYALRTGDILIILPQMVHSIEQLDSNPMEYFNILFQFSLLGGSASDKCYEKYFKPFYEHTRSISPQLSSDDPLNSLIQPYISDLIANRKQNDGGYELMIKSDLLAIMHYLNLYSTQASSEELSLHTTYRKLKKVISFVQTNYSTPLSVPLAADACGFSASHFMKLFRKLTGKSFTQYLKDFRLEIAADQLAGSTQKIIEIAENTGFNNHSYFTRSFMDKYGVSPSEYRKKHSNTAL